MQICDNSKATVNKKNVYDIHLIYIVKKYIIIMKNRIMHVDYVDEYKFQSVNFGVSKYQIDTLGCTLEELEVLKLIAKSPYIKQQEIADKTGKSLSTVKRIMKSLQGKNYIRRENGKHYGKWEISVDLSGR